MENLTRSANVFVSPEELTSALDEAIRTVKAGDALATVYVVVLNSLARQSLARKLGREQGVVNVRFLTFPEVAERLLSPVTLAGETILTDHVKREIVRQVAASARPPLNGGSPLVLARALLEVFTDLGGWSPLQLEGLEESGRLQRELVRLFREYEQKSRRYLDRSRLLFMAADAPKSECPSVIVVLTSPPDAAEQALLDTLQQASRLRTICVRSGDPLGDSTLQLWCGEWGDSGVDAVPVASRLVIAPDPEVEVELAVARLLAEARSGCSFSRMALLYSTSSPYALSMRQTLTAAGIPFYGSDGRCLVDSVSGRFVGSLLQMVDNHFELGSVLDWLSSGPIIDPRTGRLAPMPEWRRILARARIDFHSPSWREKIFGYVATNDSPVPSSPGCEDSLVEFLDGALAALQCESDSWSGWVTWLSTLLDTYLGPTGDAPQWSKAEIATALAVRGALMDLADLESPAAPVSLEKFSAAVFDELHARTSGNSLNAGVFVGSLSAVAAADFEVVIVCGMNEGRIPSVAGGRLLGALRAPGMEERTDDQRRSLLLAIAAGKRTVLSSARVDVRGSREQLPSPWFTEQAEYLAKAAVDVNDLLQTRKDWPWLDVVESFAASTRRPGMGFTSQWSSLRSTAAAFASGNHVTNWLTADANRSIAKGFEAIAKRSSIEITEYDGFTGDDSSLMFGDNDTVSPTSLENWAACPFRYFLREVLHVSGSPDDVDPWVIEPATRGLLIHAALERFLQSVPPRSFPGQAWTEQERALLVDIGRELCGELQTQGRVAGGLVMAGQMESISADLLEHLNSDEVMRAELGVLPSATGVEVGFGREKSVPVEIERPGRKPVRFHGRIDRLDRSPDGVRIAAFDYKTGRTRPEHRRIAKDDPTVAGTKLQPGIYAEYAATVGGAPTQHVSFDYWFTSGQHERVGFSWNDEVAERLHQVVGHMADGIEGGVFPMVPGDADRDSFENCRHCPYDRLCPTDRDDIAARKRESRHMLPYLRLGGTGS